MSHAHARMAEKSLIYRPDVNGFPSHTADQFADDR